MYKLLGLFLLMLAGDIYSLGDQRAILSSQATQGLRWNGSAQITSEKFEITVFEDYLDIEVEWVIQVGGNNRPQIPLSLEIIGDVYLLEKSSVVGMILWNGNDILEAKLKTSESAREEYEEVVDRNVLEWPERPKDPVLFEKITDDQYRISIFPVNYNGSRKLRFRYLVPASFTEGKNKIDFPYAFSTNPEYTVKASDDLKGFAFEMTNGITNEFENSSLNLNTSVYNVLRFNGSGDRIGWIIPRLKKEIEGSVFYIGGFERPGFSGEMLKLIGMAPRGMLLSLKDKYEGDFDLYMSITNNSDSLKTKINFNAQDPQDTYYVVTAYSKAQMRKGVIWSIYLNGELQEEFVEIPSVITMQEGLNYARVTGAGAFYPMAQTMPTSIASKLGFVDTRYALLAVEDDVMNYIEAEKYAQSGVPTLDLEDIFPSDEEQNAIPVADWINRNYEYQTEPWILSTWEDTSPVNQIQDLAENGIQFRIFNGVLSITIADWRLEQNDPIFIVIYDIRGNVVAEWVVDWVNNTSQITWNPENEGLVSGMYLLRIRTSDVNVTRSILLK